MTTVSRARSLYSGRRDVSGFTLIELLVSLVLIGIVTTALGRAFSSFLINTDATSRRLNESHDGQVAATYFAQDVSSLGLRDAASDVLQQSIDTSATPPASLACGTTGTTVVRFGWDDPTTVSSNAQMRVSYVILTVTGERQLHRLTCLGSSVVLTDVLLVHNLASTGPVITCSSPTVCTGAAVPQTVSMVLTIRYPGNTGQPYEVTLTGQRRQTS